MSDSTLWAADVVKRAGARLEQIVEVPRGAMIVVRLPTAWEEPLADIVLHTMIDKFGHDQFVVLALVGPHDQVQVYGPEGMQEVLATMAKAQLQVLAAFEAEAL